MPSEHSVDAEIRILLPRLISFNSEILSERRLEDSSFSDSWQCPFCSTEFDNLNTLSPERGGNHKLLDGSPSPSVFVVECTNRAVGRPNSRDWYLLDRRRSSDGKYKYRASDLPLSFRTYVDQLRAFPNIVLRDYSEGRGLDHLNRELYRLSDLSCPYCGVADIIHHSRHFIASTKTYYSYGRRTIICSEHPLYRLFFLFQVLNTSDEYKYCIFTPEERLDIVPCGMAPATNLEESEVPCPYCFEIFYLKTDLDDTHRFIQEWDYEGIPAQLYECKNNAEGGKFNYLKQKGKTAYVVRVTKKTKITEAKTGKIKMGWDFDSSYALEKDYTAYLSKVVVVGLELELDWKHREEKDKACRDLGLPEGVTSYHHNPSCLICGSENCWIHVPDNLIRAATTDSSISGLEFIIYGSILSSEDFAERLPLDVLKKYFVCSQKDSMHSHILIPNQMIPLPGTILRNVWQLFRYYYPGWMYLFGNNKDTIIRMNEYAPFVDFNHSAIRPEWIKKVTGYSRSGLFLAHTEFTKNMELIKHLDIEIRSNDSSLDMEQIIALRAMNKALLLRASQLSLMGVIKVNTDETLFNKAMITTEYLNLYAKSFDVLQSSGEDSTKSRAIKYFGSQDKIMDFMKEHAERLYHELAPFLTTFERKCVKSILDNPVRLRSETRRTSRRSSEETPLEVSVRKIVMMGNATEESKEKWIQTVANDLGETPASVNRALNSIGAEWDEDLNKMIIPLVS